MSAAPHQTRKDFNLCSHKEGRAKNPAFLLFVLIETLNLLSVGHAEQSRIVAGPSSSPPAGLPGGGHAGR
jgi:hypothetical protein